MQLCILHLNSAATSWTWRRNTADADFIDDAGLKGRLLIDLFTIQVLSAELKQDFLIIYAESSNTIRPIIHLHGTADCSGHEHDLQFAKALAETDVV